MTLAIDFDVKLTLASADRYEGVARTKKKGQVSFPPTLQGSSGLLEPSPLTLIPSPRAPSPDLLLFLVYSGRF